MSIRLPGLEFRNEAHAWRFAIVRVSSAQLVPRLPWTIDAATTGSAGLVKEGVWID